MKKDIIIASLLLIIGIAIGLLCRKEHIRDENGLVQIDTIYETRFYPRLELEGNTYRLDVPKVGSTRYVFAVYDSTKVVYKDIIRYVMLPREYYYTSVDDVEIWHSGIDSTIDSLNITRKTEIITKTAQTVTNRNTLSLGIEAGYCNALSIPIYLEYERMLHKNAGIYADLFYDLRCRQFGVQIGTNIQFEW